jgi:dihydroorotate dehydrogenase electron transfer subunit
LRTDERLRVFAIAEELDETPTIRTVRMDGELHAQPGQFVMVWVPGRDEFPMSVSFPGERFGITYKVVGEGTRHLSAMGPGDRLGIRGPYGRGYSLEGERVLVVAGGTGMAVLAPMVEQAVAAGVSVDIVLGARTGTELLMRSRCERTGATVYITTDDGSEGFKGLTTDRARELLDAGGYDMVYTCGPERMIVGVLELAKARSIPMQASLERYMKCGIGICDSCAIDGRHVCIDGPVFPGEALSAMAELGKTRLSPSGRRTAIE